MYFMEASIYIIIQYTAQRYVQVSDHRKTS